MAIKEGPAAKKVARSAKDNMSFSFADTIAGYVSRFDTTADCSRSRRATGGSSRSP